MIAGLVLAGLVLTAGLAPRGPRGAALLVAVALLWFLVNSDVEGPTLLKVATGHGLTAGDLAGVAAILLALCRLRTWRREEPAGDQRSASDRDAGDPAP